MTCKYVDRPPDTSPCYSTATHWARLNKDHFIPVCDDHAQELRAQGGDIRPIDSAESRA